MTGNKEDELVDKITNIYKENHGRITRSELTQQLNYNADYMNRIVKKATGMTLTEYGNIYQSFPCDTWVLSKKTPYRK